MRTSDFDYNLPPQHIAQRPLATRSASRLLYLNGAGGAIQDRFFSDFPALLRPGDLLILNDTRVIPARLYGKKQTGGQVEFLVERVLDDECVLAQARTSKPLRTDQIIELGGKIRARIKARIGDFYELAFDTPTPTLELLERIGRVPLPPYIARADDSADRERYQTVYARRAGAVAAPTAGLHFDEPMFERLNRAGIETAYVTLHIGAGTFQPPRTDDVRRHRMHTERVHIEMEAAQRINSAKRSGRRIVAVGTTAVRALEAAGTSGEVRAIHGETDIFIYPGFRFQIVDALLTNFHLPRSTLLMLVCAFGGTEGVLAAYRHAVGAQYRFYSYGDAMFVTPRR
jgi:S-adenosylmethionine:tRNA ribosyltransferase-isomerase